MKFLQQIAGTRKRLYQFTTIDDSTRIQVLKIYDACNQTSAIRFVYEVIRRMPFRLLVIQTDNVLSPEASLFVSDKNPVRDVLRRHAIKNHRAMHAAPALFRSNEILADHNKHKIRRTTTLFTAPKTA